MKLLPTVGLLKQKFNMYKNMTSRNNPFYISYWSFAFT